MASKWHFKEIWFSGLTYLFSNLVGLLRKFEKCSKKRGVTVLIFTLHACNL